MSRVIRVGLYERVSTDEQALRGYSIDAQIQSLEDFCNNNNYKIVDHYTDAGVSGGKAAFRRPQMSRLLADVEAGKIDMILFTKLDRWFRNTKEYFKVQELLEQNHVEWKTIHEDYDTTTANGRMAITIFLAIAENERDKGSERISVVLANKRKNKEACMGRASLGYTKVKDEDGIMRWAYDPETEDAVRAFWRIVQEENSIMTAGKIVNATFGLNRAYKAWNSTFNNEMYRGNYKGVVDYCPRYITPEDWERVNAARTIKKPQNYRCYLFTGLIQCPTCGCIMSSNCSTNTYKGKTSECYVYRCRHYSVRRCSNSKSISENRAEKWLMENVKDRLAAFILNAEAEDAAQKPKPKRSKNKIAEKIRRLNAAYMDGGKTDDDYLSELSSLKTQLAAAELEENTKPRDLAPLREFLASDFEEIYLSLGREEKRELWRSIIDHFVVEGNDVVDVVFKT